MSNHGKEVNIKVVLIDKGEVNERTLQEIFEIDSDFSGNEELFRSDTLKKGFENEAHRVSSEIFKKCSKKIKAEDDEFGLIGSMMEKVFEVNNFIGQSGAYGSHDYEITETDFQYVISIAYVC